MNIFIEDESKGKDNEELDYTEWLVRFMECLTFFLCDNKVSDEQKRRLVSNANKIWEHFYTNMLEGTIIVINKMIYHLKPHLLRIKSDRTIKQSNKTLG